jgi:hypothetical protein
MDAPRYKIPSATAMVWATTNGPVQNHYLEISPEDPQFPQNGLFLGPNLAVTVQDLTKPAATIAKSALTSALPEAALGSTSGMQVSHVYVTSAAQLVDQGDAAAKPFSAPFCLQHVPAIQLRTEGNNNALVIIVYYVGPDGRATSVYGVWAYTVETTFFFKKNHAERIVDIIYDVGTRIELDLLDAGGKRGCTQWKANIVDNTARVHPWKVAYHSAAARHRNDEIAYATRFDWMETNVAQKVIAFLGAITTVNPADINPHAAAWAILLASGSVVAVYERLNDTVDQHTHFDDIVQLVSNFGSVCASVDADAVTSARALEANAMDRRHVRKAIAALAELVHDGVENQQRAAAIAAHAEELRTETERLATEEASAAQADRSNIVSEAFAVVRTTLVDMMNPEELKLVDEAVGLASECAGELQATVEGVRHWTKLVHVAATEAAKKVDTADPFTDIQTDALVEATMAAIGGAADAEPSAKRRKVDQSTLFAKVHEIITQHIGTLSDDQREWIRERPAIAATGIRRTITKVNEIATRKAQKALEAPSAFISKRINAQVQELRRSRRANAGVNPRRDPL